MKSIVIAAIACLSLLGTVPTDAGGSEFDPVYVDHAEIVYLESYPVQGALVVTGTLPTPCHEVAFDVTLSTDRIDVLLWSDADPEAICAQVLAPFEVTVPLGAFEQADVLVSLGGEAVGRLQIGVDSSGPSLIGSGWSFGFCGGYCAADLVLEGDQLTLTGSVHGLTPLYEHHGALTQVGRARLESALAELEDVRLEPIYGCPDCADQGAAYLTLLRGGAVEKVAMGFATPPDELAELYDLSISLIDALEQCEPSVHVTVADDCVPYER